jgi:hypothetical protein
VVGFRQPCSPQRRHESDTQSGKTQSGDKEEEEEKEEEKDNQDEEIVSGDQNHFAEHLTHFQIFVGCASFRQGECAVHDRF